MSTNLRHLGFQSAFNPRKLDDNDIGFTKGEIAIPIYESSYKDMTAVTMESEILKVVLIPDSGGKIQSIVDTRFDKELLVQRDDVRYRRSSYDSEYASGDVSGFDEVFPSIEPCYFPRSPWQGIRIPDHGEVWALPWRFQYEDDSLSMQVHGVRFPYTLEKTLAFIRDDTLKITYKATNLSDFEFPFLWAPHALWLCESDTRIVLPQSIKRVMSTCSVQNRLGPFGTIHEWPKCTIEGEPYEIDRVYPKYPNKCEKYYALGEIEEGWCALRNENTGYAVKLSYPIDKVPFLGVWEGIMNGKYVTALEPCTAAYDALDTAMQWQRARSIPSLTTEEWFLTISVGNLI